MVWAQKHFNYDGTGADGRGGLRVKQWRYDDVTNVPEFIVGWLPPPEDRELFTGSYFASFRDSEHPDVNGIIIVFKIFTDATGIE